MSFLKKIYQKTFLLFIAAVILLTSLTFMQVNAADGLKIGEYVQFGSYNSKPILWRVVNMDNNGPLLLSDKILSLKAFDAAGSYHTDSTRKDWGSNYWKGSNIRQWLNSSDSKIQWLQNAPNEKNLDDNSTDYADEKGFLTEGNFTNDELKVIKAVNRHVLLAEFDKNKAEGGSEGYMYEGHMGEVIQNYDKAYYHTVTDKVFFLNVKEVQEYLYNRGWEYRAFPTEEIVLNARFKDFSFSSLAYWNYWLDTPETHVTHEVRFVTGLGYILEKNAKSSYCGVRPALYLDLQATRFAAGSGSVSDPYVVERGIGAVQQSAVPGNSIASIRIMVNGKLLGTDQAPFVRDGSVMVPFKAIVEAIGGKYYWDNETLMAMGGLGRTYITLMPDSPLAAISKISPNFQGEFNLQEGFNFDNFGQYVESNLFITMTVPPTMKNQQMMVPVRFIAESLGAKVEMDLKTNTVNITAP